MASSEIWKDIPGYEGYYQVSSLGRVRSTPRVTRQAGPVPERQLRGRVLAPHLGGDRSKYQAVNVSVEGKKGKIKIHQAVLTTFKGPRPSNDHVARHLDDNRDNNTVGNLEWGTVSENTLDKFKNGYEHHLWSVSLEQREAILRDPRPQRVIADEYGISQKTVWRIKQQNQAAA